MNFRKRCPAGAVRRVDRTDPADVGLGQPTWRAWSTPAHNAPRRIRSSHSEPWPSPISSTRFAAKLSESMQPEICRSLAYGNLS